MFDKLAENIVRRLIDQHIVQEDRAQLYVFGLSQGMRNLFQTCLMLVSGIAMGLFWQSVVIILAFFPIRIYAGGYHARTALQCLAESWCSFFLILLWLKFISSHYGLQLGVLYITGICLWRCSPVEDEHRPLQENEKRGYHRKALFFFGVETFLYLAVFLLGFKEFARCISLAWVLVLIILAAGLVKNYCHIRKKNN